MLPFLRKPAIYDRSGQRMLTARSRGIETDETAFASSVTELVFRKGTCQRGPLRLRDGERSIPFRFTAMFAIDFKMSEPAFVVHEFHCLVVSDVLEKPGTFRFAAMSSSQRTTASTVSFSVLVPAVTPTHSDLSNHSGCNSSARVM